MSHSAKEHGCDDQPGLGRCRLEFFRLPAAERALHGLARIVAAQQLQHAVAMMRKVGVQPDPAPVAAAIEPCDLVPDLAALAFGEAEIMLAAKFDRGVAHLDADLLLPPGAQPPQFRGRERGRRDARLRGGADGERGGECGLAAGEGHDVERGFALARMPPQRGKCFFRDQDCSCADCIGATMRPLAHPVAVDRELREAGRASRARSPGRAALVHADDGAVLVSAMRLSAITAGRRPATPTP